MTLALNKVLLDLTLLPHILLLLDAQPILLSGPPLALLQPSPHDNPKRKRKHPILRSVHNHHPVLTDLAGDLGKILWALVVQPCSERL